MNIGEMTQEQFNELLQNAVAGYVKEAGLDKIDQKYVIIPQNDAGGADEKAQLIQTKKESFGKLAKAVWNKQFTIAEKINEELKVADPNNMTTDAEGGYFVPDSTASEIIGLIPSFGQARPLVDVGTFPSNVNDWNLPMRGTGITVYYPGEKGSITTSKLGFTIITMTAKKAAALAVLTDELKRFSTVDFVNYITTRAAEAFAIDEDSKVFANDNTTFTGLFYSSNYTEGTNALSSDPNNITYDDIMGMLYSVDQKYLLNARFLCHRSIVEPLRKIKDANGNPLFVMPNAAANVPSLAGYPLTIIEQTTARGSLSSGDPFLLLGNFKNSMLKDKAGMRIDASTEATVDSTSLYQADLSALRFIRHWSFHPGLTDGYVALLAAGV